MATTADKGLFGEEDLPDNPSDFRQFYEKAFVKLIGYGIACGLNRHDAVEEVQAAMVGAYEAWDARGLSKLDYQRQETYVVRSIRNAVYDRYRAQGRLRQLLRKLGNQAEAAYVRWEYELETPTLDLLQNLPQQQRQILALLAQDWTLPEAAAHLGITASTARTHLQKARKRLRELLAAQEASNHGE